MAREIELTRGYKTLVDDDDFDELSKHTWCYSGNDGKGYAVSWIDGELLYMHHFLKGKPAKGFVIDHQNRNTIDNQKHNLVLKSHGANLRNNNFLGVGRSRRGKYVAHIKLHGVMQHKTFETLEEAVKWRANKKAANDY